MNTLPDYYDALDYEHKRPTKATPTRPKREKTSSTASSSGNTPAKDDANASSVLGTRWVT